MYYSLKNDPIYKTNKYKPFNPQNLQDETKTISDLHTNYFDQFYTLSTINNSNTLKENNIDSKTSKNFYISNNERKPISLINYIQYNYLDYLNSKNPLFSLNQKNTKNLINQQNNIIATNIILENQIEQHNNLLKIEKDFKEKMEEENKDLIIKLNKLTEENKKLIQERENIQNQQSEMKDELQERLNQATIQKHGSGWDNIIGQNNLTNSIKNTNQFNSGLKLSLTVSQREEEAKRLQKKLEDKIEEGNEKMGSELFENQNSDEIL